MTEEEAKTKACCGPPAVASATLLARKDVKAEPLDGLKWGLCIGSACMAWRTMGVVRPGDEYKTYGTGEGFCGLAGQPS